MKPFISGSGAAGFVVHMSMESWVEKYCKAVFRTCGYGVGRKAYGAPMA